MGISEERVVIKVEVNTDVAKAHAQLETFFNMLDARSKTVNRNLSDVDKKMTDIDKKTQKLTKSSGKLERSNNKVAKSYLRLKNTLKSIGSVLGTFLSKFSLFSFIGSAIEIGLVSAALLGVKLALVSGRLAVKAYQATLVGLGVAAGGVAVVLGSVAAAMRQISEVTLAPQVGGAAKAAQTMRAAMSDSQLSFFGMEGVQSSVTALAQGGVSADAGYTRILRQLGDYASDPKQLADLASIYATISKEGVISGDSLGRLEDVNSVLAEGIAELSGLTGEELERAMEGGGVGSGVFDALLSGQADATDAWEGQLERMNNTVIGTLKGMLPRMYQLFADLGAPFLDSIQQMLTKIESILVASVMRIRGSITGFGLDSFIPGFIDSFELINDWVVKLINESLPKVDGWVDSVVSAWDTVRNYFVDMARIFEPLEEAADVLMRILGPQFGGIFDGFARLIKNFAASLVENEAAFQSFGEAVGRFLEGFLNFFNTANDRFVDALPVWSNLLDTLTRDVFPALADIFGMLHEASMTVLPVVTSALGAIARAFGDIARVLAQLMSIPGIGGLLGAPVGLASLGLGAMMFKTTRKPMMAAAGAAGRSTGLFGTAAVGGAAAAPGLLSRSLARQISVPSLANPYTLAGRGAVGAIGGGGAIAAPATMSGGAVLGAGAAGAVAGYGTGTYIGNRVGGAVGVAAGGVGGLAAGAISGAAIGSMLSSWSGPGAAVGAAVGGGIGAVAGGAGAWFAHRRHDKANDAADELVDDFYDELSMMLSKGQGRAALDAAESEMEEMLADVADTAKELGVDEIELRKRLDVEKERLDKIVIERTDVLSDRLVFLSDMTGSAAEDIEHLADVTGTDLTEATGRALDQMKQMGLIDDWSMSLKGIQDFTNKTLQENLFGTGSVFEQTFAGPEKQDSLNALVNEALDVKNSGGELGGDLVRNIVSGIIAVDQIEYGMEGADLLQGLTIDLKRMDETLGTGGLFQSMMPDVERTLVDIYDPEKNPALMGLNAAIYDQLDTSVAGLGKDEAWLQAETAKEFERSLDILKALDPKDFDERLSQMLIQVGNEEQYKNMESFNGELIRATEYLRLFRGGDEIAKTVDAEQYEQYAWARTYGASPFDGSGVLDPTRTGASVGLGSAVNNQTSQTLNAKTSYQLTYNVEGITDAALVAKIKSVAEASVRNLIQRGAASGGGSFFVAPGGQVGA